MKDSEVIQNIWSRSEGDNIYVPRSANGRWIEGDPQSPTVYPNTGMVTGDQYFTPLRFNGPRRKEHVGNPGVIFADLDGVTEDTATGLREMPPSVMIVSSPGHFHAYWYLDEPVEPWEWEPRARGWTNHIDADPGGWDLTQVLRLPGTRNHKPGVDHEVYVMLYEPGRQYSLEDFPPMLIARSHTGADPIPDPALAVSYKKRAIAIGTLPLTAQYWLNVTYQELKALGKIDRSKILWALYKQLYEAGFTPVEIFHMTYFSAVNKFKDHPGRLWGEINKAALG